METSYRFRQNCESSDAILQSFVDNSSVGSDYLVSSETGDVYRYKPPTGLNVRIVKQAIKSEVEEEIGEEQSVENEEEELEEEILGDSQQDHEMEIMVEEHEQNDDDLETEVLDDSNDNENENQYPEEVLEYDSTDDIIADELLKNNVSLQKTVVKGTDMKAEEFFEISEIIRPVRKSNFSRNKIPPNKPTVEQITTEIGPDGVGTAIIRVKRNLDTTKPLKVCEICGNSYKYRHALDSHMRRHRGEKPFICNYDNCGKSFVIPFELKRHQRIHTGQKPYGKYLIENYFFEIQFIFNFFFSLGCKYCERKFSDFGSRIKHERVHTGERPYSCETCGKSFAYSHVLSSHLLTHTGEKKFGCEQCGKRFTKSHHLKAHLNTHRKVLGKSFSKTVESLSYSIDSPNMQNRLVIIMNDEKITKIEPASEDEIELGDEQIIEELQIDQD